MVCQTMLITPQKLLPMTMKRKLSAKFWKDLKKNGLSIR